MSYVSYTYLKGRIEDLLDYFDLTAEEFNSMSVEEQDDYKEQYNSDHAFDNNGFPDRWDDY